MQVVLIVSGVLTVLIRHAAPPVAHRCEFMVCCEVCFFWTVDWLEPVAGMAMVRRVIVPHTAGTPHTAFLNAGDSSVSSG